MSDQRGAAWQPFALAPRDGQVIQANRRNGKRDFPPPSEFRFDAERSCWLQNVLGSWERALFTPTHWRALIPPVDGSI